MAVKPVPEGYHTVTPYLCVQGAAKLMEFIKQAFDGQSKEYMSRPDGTVAHAEMRIGDSVVMLAESQGPWKPMPSTLYVYVPDVDAVYKKAIAAGAESISEPADQFYGDRHGGVKDASGNMWWIATRVEDVPPEEMKRRAEEWAKKQAGK